MTTLNKISDESCRKITSTNAITIIILGQESNYLCFQINSIFGSFFVYFLSLQNSLTGVYLQLCLLGLYPYLSLNFDTTPFTSITAHRGGGTQGHCFSKNIWIFWCVCLMKLKIYVWLRHYINSILTFGKSWAVNLRQ